MELVLEEVVIYPYFSPYFVNCTSIFRDISVAVIASILSAVILKLLPLRPISDYFFLHLKQKELDSRISEFFDLYCANTRNNVKDGPHHKCNDSDKFYKALLISTHYSISNNQLKLFYNNKQNYLIFVQK